MSSPCHYFNKNTCRSCQWIDQPVHWQLKQKEELLAEALCFAEPYQSLPTVTGPSLHFRNRAKIVVSGTQEHPVFGILSKGNLDQGVEILDCPVHHLKINEVLHGLTDFIRTSKIDPYQISTQTGELKGMIFFYSERSDEMYVRFILRSKEAISRIQKYAPVFLKKFPFIQSLSCNIQPVPHAILEGKEEVFIFGNGSIRYQLKHLQLSLSPQAFVQTNTQVAERLYETAANWVSEIQSVKFSELYCGQGAFSFFMKDQIKEALSFEINRDAVDAANFTAKRLGAEHLRFQAADAATVQHELREFAPDTVLVNPPRRGLGETVSLLQSLQIPNLLYSSCSGESLAQDLKLLTHYQLERVQIFDLFPHTRHFEILAKLSIKHQNH